VLKKVPAKFFFLVLLAVLLPMSKLHAQSTTDPDQDQPSATASEHHWWPHSTTGADPEPTGEPRPVGPRKPKKPVRKAEPAMTSDPDSTDTDDDTDVDTFTSVATAAFIGLRLS
jgi:hypothetical protein